jgi:hypothetical protein
VSTAPISHVEREKKEMKEQQTPNEDVIWVLLDAPEGGDLSRYAGPVQIDAEKLGEHLRTFTGAVSKALRSCRTLAGEFELTEVTLEAKLSAEVGFALVSKAGMEGTVSFKFEKEKRSEKS